MSEPLMFPPGSRFALPNKRCCNCGSIAGLAPGEIVALVPDPLGLPDRARRSIVLDVAVCASAACVRSLRRRPPAWFALAGIGALVGLLLLALCRYLLPDQVLLDSGAALAGFVAGGAIAGCAWRWLQRADKPASSRFMPVRIRRVRVSGLQVRQIAFDFTQAECARDFALAHAAPIAAGGLASRHISGR